MLLAGLGHACAVAGRDGEARSVLGRVEELSRGGRYVSPCLFGLMREGLREDEAALSWFERAYAERDEELGLLRIDPRLDRLRGRARFERLLRRVGPA